MNGNTKKPEYLKYYTNTFPEKEGFYLVYNLEFNMLRKHQFHKLSNGEIIGESGDKNSDEYKNSLFCYVPLPEVE